MTGVVEKRWVAVYANSDFIQVETNSGYRGGLPDPFGKRFEFITSVADDVLGHAVLNALVASRFLHPHDYPDFFDIRGRVVPQYEEWVKVMMENYGYKTRRALFRSMKNCSIEERDGEITIRPTHHEKLEAWSGSGISEDSLVRVGSADGPTEVGAALRLALSRCTG